MGFVYGSLDGLVVVTGHEWLGHCKSTASSESCPVEPMELRSIQNSDGATEDRKVIKIEIVTCT